MLMYTILTKPFFLMTLFINTMSMIPFNLTLFKKHTNFNTQ